MEGGVGQRGSSGLLNPHGETVGIEGKLDKRRDGWTQGRGH